MGAWDEVSRLATSMQGRRFFTTPHFDGYPIVLVQLDRISADDLREVVTEAWLVRK